LSTRICQPYFARSAARLERFLVDGEGRILFPGASKFQLSGLDDPANRVAFCIQQLDPLKLGAGAIEVLRFAVNPEVDISGQVVCEKSDSVFKSHS
jgi:hypothetical protein